MNSGPGRRCAALIVAALAAGSCTGQPAPLPPPPPGHILIAAPRSCPMGIENEPKSPLPVRQTVRAMHGHVPHWLPAGFGLEGTWANRDSVWATWTDGRCRMVTAFWMPSKLGPTPGPRVGRWTVVYDVPGGCGNGVLGAGTCLAYQADTSDGSVGLNAIGIDRSIGDRIVRLIPL